MMKGHDNINILPKCEVCIDSVASALAAEKGGAARIELCANLFEGGTTPSLGMIRQVMKKCRSIDVFVMIRPRGGDFCYDEEEFEVMKQDVLLCKEEGVAGCVFGLLLPDGTVDMHRTRQLVELARPLQVTFHRAFDMSRDPFEALEQIIQLGIERVLTSGHEVTCMEGLDTLRQLVECAGSRITVVPGGGITERNVHKILRGSGATEFHTSARVAVESLMQHRRAHVFMGGCLRPPEFTVSVAHEAKVASLISKSTHSSPQL